MLPEDPHGEQADFVFDCFPEPRMDAIDNQCTCCATGTELEKLEKTEKLKWCVALRAKTAAFQTCPCYLVAVI